MYITRHSARSLKSSNFPNFTSQSQAFENIARKRFDPKLENAGGQLRPFSRPH
ncbi:hypothetical protein SAMD00023353_0102370 [Rosellinia necatrix]|uniref:Uncharacterized protein n=1 Tax=Rosellinia necatrix TaxID=77044 RepID=A0A1S8A592_ROSNE|nr:hypothetical protein SAMD00023353_0102370 [Rosellinia necatrix]